MPETNPNVVTVNKIENIKSENFFSAYANNVAVLSNYFDMTMTFGSLVGISPDGVVQVEQVGKVVLTLPQAKLLVMSIASQITQYEARFGEIVLPRDMVPPELLQFATEVKKENESR